MSSKRRKMQHSSSSSDDAVSLQHSSSSSDDAVSLLFDVNSTKADSDKKEYRLIALANGMRCLLIHDPDTSAGSNGAHHDESDDCSEDGDSEDESGSDSDGSEDSSDESGLKKAAVAMAVGVGSFSDPKCCQGLAHFCEHMCFMGSAKYPGENEYDQFVSQHGGSTNAVSATCLTTSYVPHTSKLVVACNVGIAQLC
jgi:Insulinase (Peptidase family M16)